MHHIDSDLCLSAPSLEDRFPEETPAAEPALPEPDDRSIPELDVYLFNMGEHRRAHRFLGAHLVPGGVRFAVWAPNAQHVSVVGSFNGWNPHAHALERRG